MEFIALKNWFDILKDSEFIIIAGPCAAENERQIIQTAAQIKKMIPYIYIFRAGLWKPRTTPNSFEGVGAEGLKWLKKVKKKYNFLITTEVANAKHVEIILKEQTVDILWLGARTVSNPFSIQEIADALKGVNIPVMVKNPVFPELKLWIGAIERIYKNGINKIAAIHRGFYPFQHSNLRNIPKWELPIELKTTLPSISIIGDPSHMAGKRELIHNLANFALNLNFDGLMIETHTNPTEALSDARQQLTPKQLKALLETLDYKKKSIDKDKKNILENFRNQIDSIDYQLIELLAQRMEIVKKIGNFKKENKISIFDLRRWQQIKETRIKFGKELGLDKNFIKTLLQLIHKQSIAEQQNKNNER